VRKATQYASAPSNLTIFWYFARWHMFRHVRYLRHKQQVEMTFWPWKWCRVRVTCDVGYTCANFSLPRPLCYRVRPDERDWQTSNVRQKHRLMPPSWFDTVVENWTSADSKDSSVVESLSSCCGVPSQVSCVLSAFIFSLLLYIRASTRSTHLTNALVELEEDATGTLKYTRVSSAYEWPVCPERAST